MRDFGCYYYIKHYKKLHQITNKSCWAGLKHFDKNINPKSLWGRVVNDESINLKLKKSIYIDSYIDPLTEMYIEPLLNIINQITLCKLEEIDKKVYIKYNLLEKYDQNLILLNFIRNLWHTPVGKSFTPYTTKFFENIVSNPLNYKDPISLLTWANKDAVEEVTNKVQYLGSPGHSNVHDHNRLIVKDLPDFLEFNYGGTSAFLTTFSKKPKN